MAVLRKFLMHFVLKLYPDMSSSPDLVKSQIYVVLGGFFGGFFVFVFFLHMHPYVSIFNSMAMIKKILMHFGLTLWLKNRLLLQKQQKGLPF